jgi:N-acetylmuramic acid 6-phosphate etherase
MGGMKDRSKLATEKRNPRSADIDRRDALGIVDAINAEDALIAPAVHDQRRQIAAGVEIVVDRLRRGGRLFYVGAGTSGRLGVLDASECPPTFGVPPTRVQGIIAGGRRALVRSAEGAEDDAPAGAAAVAKRRVSAGDVVVGIAACGVTPFVHGALRQARSAGAATMLVTCSPEAARAARGGRQVRSDALRLPSALRLGPDGSSASKTVRRSPGRARGLVDVVICPAVGPEVVTGSTRMKAGTATKLVLNTLTTAAMIRLGKVYGNLMVDLRATNAKLRDRSERIVMALTGLPRPKARRLLTRAAGAAKPAIVMHRRQVGLAEAEALLAAAGGLLRAVIDEQDEQGV